MLMRANKPKQTPSFDVSANTFGNDTAARVASLAREVAALRQQTCDVEAECVQKADSIEQMLTHRRAKRARNAIALMKIEGNTHE